MRVAIIRHLTEHELVSPSGLSKVLGAPLGVTSYHVRRLASLGFLELVKRVPRRGAMEHFYRLRTEGPTARTQLDRSETLVLLGGEASGRVELHALLDEEALGALRASVVQLYFRIEALDAAAAARADAASARFAVDVSFVVEPADGQLQAHERR